jgi:hypothetical protein
MRQATEITAMKTATFSTGFTDVYKGTRNVQAAWMIVLPDGKVMSGHSMNRQTAEKTARGTAAQFFRVGVLYHYQALRPMARWAHMQGRVREILRATHFKSVREHDAALADARAAFVATCKIEVVDL